MAEHVVVLQEALVELPPELVEPVGPSPLAEEEDAAVEEELVPEPPPTVPDPLSAD